MNNLCLEADSGMSAFVCNGAYSEHRKIVQQTRGCLAMRDLKRAVFIIVSL